MLLPSLEKTSWKREESMTSQWVICVDDSPNKNVEQAIEYMVKQTRFHVSSENTATLRRYLFDAINLIHRDEVDAILEKFIELYEEYHDRATVAPTEINPSPEDEPVVRMLCKFVGLDQDFSSLVLWLELIESLAVGSLHVRYVLLSEKFHGYASGLLLTADDADVKTKVCRILSLMSNTILPDHAKPPLHLSYVEIILRSLEGSDSVHFATAACQTLAAIAEALSLNLWPRNVGSLSLENCLSHRALHAVERVVNECESEEVRKSLAKLSKLRSLTVLGSTRTTTGSREKMRSSGRRRKNLNAARNSDIKGNSAIPMTELSTVVESETRDKVTAVALQEESVQTKETEDTVSAPTDELPAENKSESESHCESEKTSTCRNSNEENEMKGESENKPPGVVFQSKAGEQEGSEKTNDIPTEKEADQSVKIPSSEVSQGEPEESSKEIPGEGQNVDVLVVAEEQKTPSVVTKESPSSPLDVARKETEDTVAKDDEENWARKKTRKSWVASKDFVPCMLSDRNLADEIRAETPAFKAALEKRKNALDSILYKCMGGLNSATLREILRDDVKDLEVAAALNLLTALSCVKESMWDTQSLHCIFEVLGKFVVEPQLGHNVEACDIFRYFLHIFESADSAEEATVGSCYELLKNLHGKLVKLLGNVAFLSPMESGQDEALLARHSLLASLEQVFTF
ncbi:uncharacterized protein [Oscarella lobularis]